MAYTPNSVAVYSAAFNGALAGMTTSGRYNTSASSSDYQWLCQTAGAFAQQFDTSYAGGTVNALTLEAIQSLCAASWSNRQPANIAAYKSPSAYATRVSSIIATIVAAGSYFTAEGITPIPAAAQASGIGHLDFLASTAFTVPGSGAGAVPIPSNPGGGVNWEVSPYNQYFEEYDLGSNVSALRYTGSSDVTAMVFCYATLQLSGGGTALVQLSLSVDGTPDSDVAVIQASSNRPNFILNTTPVRLSNGSYFNPLIENVESATDVQVYAAHISVLYSVQL